MKITLSQEGSTPITIRTASEKTIRSAEDYVIKDNNEGLSDEEIKKSVEDVCELFCFLRENTKMFFPKADAYPIYELNIDSPDYNYIKQNFKIEDVVAYGSRITEVLNKLIHSVYPNIKTIFTSEYSYDYANKTFFQECSAYIPFSWSSTDAMHIINKCIEETKTLVYQLERFVDLRKNEEDIHKRKIEDDVAKARGGNNQTATSNTQQNNSGIDIKQAGIGAVGVGAAIGLTLVARLIAGTIYNKVASIGNFNSGNEMLQSPKLLDNLSKVRNKFTKPASANDVKSNPEAKTKSSFLAWILGQGESKKIISNVGSVSLIVKDVDGVAVSVTTLSGSNGKIMLATAYGYNNSNKLVSIPLARGFLNSGNMVNASRECADIYFGKDNKTYTKNDILNMVKSIRSGECGPITLGEAVHVIDDLSL